MRPTSRVDMIPYSCRVLESTIARSVPRVLLGIISIEPNTSSEYCVESCDPEFAELQKAHMHGVHLGRSQDPAEYTHPWFPSWVDPENIQ